MIWNCFRPWRIVMGESLRWVLHDSNRHLKPRRQLELETGERSGIEKCGYRGFPTLRDSNVSFLGSGGTDLGGEVGKFCWRLKTNTKPRECHYSCATRDGVEGTTDVNPVLQWFFYGWETSYGLDMGWLKGPQLSIGIMY